MPKHLTAFIFVSALLGFCSDQVEASQLVDVNIQPFDKGDRITCSFSEEPQYQITPGKGVIKVWFGETYSVISDFPSPPRSSSVKAISALAATDGMYLNISLKKQVNLTAFMSKQPCKLIIDLYPVKSDSVPTKPVVRNTPMAKGTTDDKTNIEDKKNVSPNLSKRSASDKPSDKPSDEPNKPPADTKVRDDSDQISPNVSRESEPTNETEIEPNAPDLATMLKMAEEPNTPQEGNKIPEVGPTVSPFFMVQVILNICFMTAIYLLWRRVRKLSAMKFGTERQVESPSSTRINRGSKLEREKIVPMRSGKKPAFDDVLADVAAVGDEVRITSSMPNDDISPKARKIRKMLKQGMSIEEIARETGITKGEVELISSLSGL